MEVKVIVMVNRDEMNRVEKEIRIGEEDLMIKKMILESVKV